MNKISKLLSIIVVLLLVLTPCYCYANEINENNNETGENQENPENNNEEQENIEYTISLDKTSATLEMGETLTLVANANPDSQTIIWESSDTSVATVNNGLVTAVSAGTATITAKIEGTDKTATCTITVNEKVETEVTLKSLTISNGKLENFSSDVYEYNVEVEADVDKLDITYELSDSSGGCLITGNSDLKNGSIVTILITTTQKTYKLKIVKEEISLNLKSLGINGYPLNETFNPERLEYTVNIPYEIQIVTVNYKAESKKVKVTVTGGNKLMVGQNAVKITVADEDGNSKTYRIIVTRETEVKSEENPTSIITSVETNNTSISNNDILPTSDSGILKYIIVSVACLILVIIGGLGIYFYIKTSPKKIKKALMKQEQANKKESPIVEVEENKNSNIESMMDITLVETREFDAKEIKSETLFDEDEDRD